MYCGFSCILKVRIFGGTLYNIKLKSAGGFLFMFFCGAFIHHLAAMVQRTLQNSTKKFFWDTLGGMSKWLLLYIRGGTTKWLQYYIRGYAQIITILHGGFPSSTWFCCYCWKKWVETNEKHHHLPDTARLYICLVSNWCTPNWFLMQQYRFNIVHNVTALMVDIVIL